MPRLEPITERVWGALHDHRMYGMHFPARMTVIRLDGGGLWLHSPVPIDDLLAAELAAIGRVRHLVAPNRFHHVHLDAASARYPDAQVWACPGLANKRPELRIDGTVLDDDLPWTDEFRLALVRGADELSEVAFLHLRSRTLLLADLAFNIHRCPGVVSPLVYRMAGAWKTFQQSRLWRKLTRDRAAAQASVEEILTWSFDRVVPCHGDVVDHDAKRGLETALWWMRGVPKRAAG